MGISDEGLRGLFGSELIGMTQDLQDGTVLLIAHLHRCEGWTIARIERVVSAVMETDI